MPTAIALHPGARPPALAVLAALAIAGASAAAARPARIAHAQIAAPSACAFRGLSSSLDRSNIPIGGTARLSLRWGWACDEGAPPHDVLIVVDPTTAFAGDGNAELRAAYVRLALANFADRMDASGGRRFGTISAACPPLAVSPMASGTAAKAAWREALLTLAPAPARDMAGAYARAAATLADLPHVAGLGQPIVLVIDAGGATCPTATPPPDLGANAVCPILEGSGAYVITVAVDTATVRPQRCNSPGWYFRAGSPDAANLPAILSEIAARITRATAPPVGAATRLRLDTDRWSLVSTEPTAAASSPDLIWERDIDGWLVGQMTVHLTVRIKDGVAPGRYPLSGSEAGGPRAELVDPSGYKISRSLPNPSVCVYRPGHEGEDCGTSTAPPPTDPAAPTPTADALPTAAPSPEPVPPGRRLWLPWTVIATDPGAP